VLGRFSDEESSNSPTGRNDHLIQIKFYIFFRTPFLRWWALLR
jgi:hypothetical protein